jgi:hypothetical protein
MGKCTAWATWIVQVGLKRLLSLWYFWQLFGEAQVAAFELSGKDHPGMLQVRCGVAVWLLGLSARLD